MARQISGERLIQRGIGLHQKARVAYTGSALRLTSGQSFTLQHATSSALGKPSTFVIAYVASESIVSLMLAPVYTLELGRNGASRRVCDRVPEMPLPVAPKPALRPLAAAGWA